MKHKIIVSTQMMIHNQKLFRSLLEEKDFDVDFIMNTQFLDEADCLNIPPHYDGWIAGDDMITAQVIDHHKDRLKVISKWGTGIDSIDKDYAEKNGIKVKNSPGAFPNAVGEMAVAYLLSLTRGIVETDRKVREGQWPKKQYKNLTGMQVGLIGMGAIGQGVARRLEALGCIISYSDPVIELACYHKKSQKDLFVESDTIIVTCNLNPSTYHLVNKDMFSLSKKGIYLINVARGPVVIQSDLIEALETGKVIGAALDVFEDEPLSMDNPLRKFDNVILGSHNANNTQDAVEFVHKNTIDNLVKYLRN